MSKQLLIDNLKLTRAFAALMVLASASSALAGDWNVAPSTFTHSPETGRRTTQYQPKQAAIRPPAQAGGNVRAGAPRGITSPPRRATS